MGSLNGRKAFFAQSLYDLAYSTIRLVAIPGLALAASSALGALAGFSLASLVIVLLAAWRMGLGERGRAFADREFFGFGAAMLVFHVLANLLMNVDLYMVKILAGPGAASNAEVGFYSANLTVARVPFMLFAALNLVVFPLMAAARSEGDEVKLRGRVTQSLRAALVMVAGPCALIAADAGGVLGFIYPAAYQAGRESLALLAAAYGFYTLFMFAAAMLQGLGRSVPALAAALVALVLAAILARVFIPAAGIRGAALASFAAFGAGLAVIAVYMARQGWISLANSFFFKLTLTTAGVAALSAAFPASGAAFVLKNLALAALYGAAVIFFQIVEPDLWKRLMPRRG
jgi:O-antigen/teichoic acid export membrane protein